MAGPWASLSACVTRPGRVSAAGFRFARYQSQRRSYCGTPAVGVVFPRQNRTCFLQGVRDPLYASQVSKCLFFALTRSAVNRKILNLHTNIALFGAVLIATSYAIEQHWMVDNSFELISMIHGVILINDFLPKLCRLLVCLLRLSLTMCSGRQESTIAKTFGLDVGCMWHFPHGPEDDMLGNEHFPHGALGTPDYSAPSL